MESSLKISAEGHTDSSSSDAPRLVYNTKALAQLLGVSIRHIHRMDTAGKLPRAVRFGRAKRWRVQEIHKWLDHGAPPRKEWEALKTATRKGVRHGA